MQKSSAGFTLIELIIVIMIIGILAVVAAPKMMNFTTDARVSVVESMKASLVSGQGLVNMKATMASLQFKAAVAAEDSPVEGVALVYGYPEAKVESVKNVLDVTEGDWEFHQKEEDTKDLVVITPKGIDYSDVAEEQCFITYKAAESVNQKPTITLKTEGC